jgi:hypothetical protein
MHYIETIANHLLPVMITVGLFLAMTFFYIGLPYLHYIKFVAAAKDEEGINNFAKYLASQTGGKHIDVNDAWESFIPAADKLHDLYLQNAVKVYFSNNKK